MFGSDWPVCKVARAEHSQVSKKIHVQTCEPTLQFIINSNDNPSTNAIDDCLYPCQVVDLLMELVSDLSKEEKEKIFYSNAIKFYNLKI